MRHWGLIFLVILLIQEQGIFLQVEADDGFIRTKGVQFLLNGSPFYANGFNGYWLMYFATDTSQRDKVTSVFQDAKQHGLTLARTWAFNDGQDRALQVSPGYYNEQTFQVIMIHLAFYSLSSLLKFFILILYVSVNDLDFHFTFGSKGLDFVISEAKKNGIKLILSLVNNYENFGGRKQYVNWASSQGQSISSLDDFYTNSVVKGYYKNHIKVRVTLHLSVSLPLLSIFHTTIGDSLRDK